LHNNAVRQVSRYQDKRPLRLGCPEDYNDSILPRLIAALKQQQPTCSIQVYSMPSVTLREWLDEDKIDAAILTRSPNSEEGHWLAHDQGVWIKQKNYEIDRTQPLPLALFQQDCKYHAAAIDGLSKKGISYQLLACCNTASAQRAIVRQGLAIGAMGKLSVSADLEVVTGFPPLPAVDIVLVTGINPHPLIAQIDFKTGRFL